jgi:hypothetical protein
MAGRKAGPTCATDLGAGWIDGGTTCRARSSPSGPLGMLMSMLMGAAPEDDPAVAERERKLREEQERNTQLRLDRELFKADIDLIAKSKFGKTKYGVQIVKILRDKLARGGIVYGPTIEGDRGGWDGETITVDEQIRGQGYPTALELVHEGAHALWRKNHPRGKGPPETLDVIIDEELLARELQLDFYLELKADYGCQTDMILEIRLERRKAGTLRRTIAAQFE